MLACLVSSPVVVAEEVVSRIAATGANRAQDSTAALGISSMECKCSYTMNEDLDIRFWSFDAEPRIRGVNPAGPARGMLKSGDRIVAIDGMLITTHEAGKRFANIVIGEPVDLTVRRGGSLVDVTIVPVETDNDEGSRIDGQGGPLSKDWASLRMVLEELSEAGLELNKLSEDLDAIDLGDLDFAPLGWFGFGLSFSGSVRRSSDGESRRWMFFEPPEIESITPGGPADRAGLERGDVITHIDGVRIDTKRGGRRFSEVVPGQRVEFEVRRLGWSRTIELIAEEKPETDPVK
jgi:predicted metalloprotease with PDZ domain